MDNNVLQDKVIVVSGGSRGVGLRVVQQALRAGAKVACCARKISEAILAVEEEYKDDFLFVYCDVSNEANSKDFFEKIDHHFGTIDVLINNAATSVDSLLISLETEEWNYILKNNLDSVFLLTQQAIKRFLAQDKKGCVLMVGSLAAEGSPTNAVYAVAKGGSAGIVEHINRHYRKRNIFGNLVTLGFIETTLTRDYPDFAKRVLIESCPLKRAGNPYEVAKTILHIASYPESYYQNNIHISGGLIDFPLDYPSRS